MKPSKSRNFKQNLRHFFVIYALIPLILLMVLFFIFTMVIPPINIKSRTERANKLVYDEIDTESRKYYDYALNSSHSDEIIDFLGGGQQRAVILDHFYKFNNSNNIKSVFYLMDRDKQTVISTKKGADQNHEFTIQSAVSRIDKNPDEVLVEINTIDYFDGTRTCYTFGTAVKQNNKVIGYVLLQINEADLIGALAVPNNEISVVTDIHNNIIAATNSKIKNVFNKFEYEYGIKPTNRWQFKGEDYFIEKSQNSFFHLNVYTLNVIEDQKALYFNFLIFSIYTLVFLLILLQVLANKMSRTNTKSIDKLIYAVEQIQNGNLEYHITIDSDDEFRVLGDQYNIMVDRIKDLILKNEDLSNLTRQAEVKKLEAQFNPHFIFNVLEALRYSIYIDIEISHNIIVSLSRLLKYSIYNNEQDVFLKDDINYINEYLNLHKMRFKDKISYTVNIKGDLYEAKIPKLILQPIVENSIKYGYRYQDKLSILIEGYQLHDDLYLEVTDNGQGLHREELEEVLDMINSPQMPDSHIGLYNINRRLILLYGEAYRLRIINNDGVSFKVIVKIKYKSGEGYV